MVFDHIQKYHFKNFWHPTTLLNTHVSFYFFQRILGILCVEMWYANRGTCISSFPSVYLYFSWVTSFSMISTMMPNGNSKKSSIPGLWYLAKMFSLSLVWCYKFSHTVFIQLQKVYPSILLSFFLVTWILSETFSPSVAVIMQLLSCLLWYTALSFR